MPPWPQLRPAEESGASSASGPGSRSDPGRQPRPGTCCPPRRATLAKTSRGVRQSAQWNDIFTVVLVHGGPPSSVDFRYGIYTVTRPEVAVLYETATYPDLLDREIC